MKKLSIKFVGQEEPNLNLNLGGSKEEKKNVVIVEDVAETKELPESGNKVTIDRDVLEGLILLAKRDKESKSQLSESSLTEKLALAIDKLAEASEVSNGADRRFLGGRPVDAVSIDKSDLIENGGFAIFFAKSVSFALYDDIRNGHTIKTPYGRGFKFKTLQRTVDKSSQRTPVYMSLSAVIVRSKKEAEWLRNHTLFGIKFHEQKDGGKDISDDLQDKIVKAWQIVSSYDDHTVMQRCIGENLNVDTPDITTLRKRLSFQIAKNMSRDEEKLRSKPIQDLENKLQNKILTSDEQNFAMPTATY